MIVSAHGNFFFNLFASENKHCLQLQPHALRSRRPAAAAGVAAAVKSVPGSTDNVGAKKNTPAVQADVAAPQQVACCTTISDCATFHGCMDSSPLAGVMKDVQFGLIENFRR